MAVLYITEYVGLMPSPVGGQGQVPIEPPLAEQTVTIGVGSLASAAFNAKTRLVRLHSDVVCSLVLNANPTATAANQRFAANATEYKGVPVGLGYKVAVITNS